MVDALVSQRQFRGGRAGSFHYSSGSRVAENIVRRSGGGETGETGASGLEADGGLSRVVPAIGVTIAPPDRLDGLR